MITLVNVGLSPHFVASWMKAFGVAYMVGVPVIFFVAPMARKLTARLVGPALEARPAAGCILGG